MEAGSGSRELGVGIFAPCSKLLAPSFLHRRPDASTCTLGKIRGSATECAPRSGRIKENGATGCDYPPRRI